MTFEETLTTKEELKNKLDYYKKILDDKYNRANSSSKKSRIALDLYNFAELYENLLGEDIDTYWMNDDILFDMAINDDMSSTDAFISHIVNNNKFYNEFSDRIISIYKNNKFPFYHNYNKYVENMKRITNNEMLDIICSFLNCYDENLCKEFRNKIKENEILTTDNLDIFDGLTTNIASINKNFIILDQSQGKNINFAKTLLHELGHSFEYKLQNNTNMSLKIFDTPFYEISSSFFEYTFLNFLEENKIYNEDVNNCFNSYFREIFHYTFDVNLISKMESFYVDDNKDIHLLDEKVISYGEKLKKEINFYQLPEQNSKINLIPSYIYSLGMIFSVYLYEIYKNDPNNFKKDFAKVLCEYPLIKDMTVFEKIGVTKKELLEGKTYTKVLKKHLENMNN